VNISQNRPLFDDGKSEAKAATRDYVLKVDGGTDEAPLLSIYGGKITTYRKLAEAVLKKLHPYFPTMGGDWTEKTFLPGGDFPPGDIALQVKELQARYPVIAQEHAARLIRYYGTRAFTICQGLKERADLGTCFGADLYEVEVRYLMTAEWARTADDVLWRRSNLGLLLKDDEKEALSRWMQSQP
jgi:glycerol-3-phosphate dehydrogenase